MAAFNWKHYTFWKLKKIGMTSVNITLSYKSVKTMQVGTWFIFQPFLFFAPSINNHQEQTVMDNNPECPSVFWYEFGEPGYVLKEWVNRMYFWFPAFFIPNTRDAEFDLKLSVKSLWSEENMYKYIGTTHSWSDVT